MKSQQPSNRSRKVTIRFSQQEYDLLLAKSKETICRQLSEYLRDILINEVVTVRYRNKTADEFLPVIIKQKNELNTIGNNLNQLIKSLHQSAGNGITKSQLETIEAGQFSLHQKIEEIKTRTYQIYKLWSQK